MPDLQLDANGLMNEAAQLHAELVKRCIFLSGRLAAVEAELKALKGETRPDKPDPAA